MNVITTKQSGYMYQEFISRDMNILVEWMRQARAQAKKSWLEIVNPFDCTPSYKLTIETIEI